MRPNNSTNCGHCISKFRREWVFHLDGRECVYCGEPFAKTIDHVVPASHMPYAPKYIVNAITNLVTACEYCNTVAKNRDPLNFKPRFGRFARYQYMEVSA